MKITTKILVACLPGIVAGALLGASTGDRAVNKPNEAAMAKVKNALGKMPLSFEPNRGQTDPRVQFLSRGPGYTVFFTPEETVMTLRNTKTSNAVVRMKFVGGTNSASVRPIDALPGQSNYLIGSDASKWVTSVPGFSKIRYENVYPGIDVVYQGEQKQLRYDFIVKPGASADAIQMAFEGAENVSINKNGDLALTIGGRTLVTTKPFTYQEDAGAKKEVASHFAIKNGRVTFEIAKYDTTKDLVIDPSVVFVTFLGGLLNDSVNGVAIVNPTFSVSSLPSAYFVTGTTTSDNFPTTAGVLPSCPTNTPNCLPGGLNGTTHTGVEDVFVTKISFTGSQILWSTYLGGNSKDTAAAIAVDALSNQAGPNSGSPTCAQGGCPIVVGQTFSANFPTVPFQTPTLSGSNDAFAAKLAADGKSLLYSTYIGGAQNDQATGVTVDVNSNVFVGGYTDSPLFLCPGNVTLQCTNASTNNNPASSDAFVVKIPANYPTGGFASIQSTLFGGFGEEFAHGIAYNRTNNMVYLGGDTTTGAQNSSQYSAPAVNLPVTNNTVLPGPVPARGGFVAAFDATTLTRSYASYVAVSPATGTCGGVPCNQGFETITGIAAEGGVAAPAAGCTGATATATPVCGNIGHVYITGDTTSHVDTKNIAINVPQFACVNPIAASSINVSTTRVIGPNGTTIVIPGGTTIPSGCVTALMTQAPFNNNQAVTTGCPYPLALNQSSGTTFTPTPTCNLSAYVAIMDGALLTAPTGIANAAGIGNQIEYFAYYSSANASTISNAIAIDTNPTTLNSTYSLGTYQQMYITGSSEQTVAGGGNFLPLTNVTANPANSTSANPSEIFWPYNVGTTAGGGVGGYTPNPSGVAFETDAFVARFNANALAASSYGGQGNANAANPNLMGYGCPSGTVFGVTCNGQTVPPVDHSFLIHTPQFNFGEFLYTVQTADGGTGSPNTVGNAIAVDPTRAALIGGSTNVTSTCPSITGRCFATTNSLPAVGAQNNGGTDGWVSVLFFNDILTDASSISTANPWLQPGAPSVTQGANGSYIETTPAPFGPTFDFAISDPSTQTQTFRVLFTGQTSGQLVGQTPWFIPLDARSGANAAAQTFDNNLPGSGIAYYVPCVNPATVPTTFTFVPAGAASQGYYNNAYPAPGTAYGPQTCAFPTNHLYEGLPVLFSGYPGTSTVNGTLTTPGWLVLSQDINPGVVRMQLDRRAAAGLLEGTYVAQFLVTTYDSQHPSQWPPCGPQGSATNPFRPVGACTDPSTPLPADNVSVLVTVRLVVRPTLFLSRNAGILTGVTSSLSANPLSGPTATINIQNGTSKVPDWLYTGTTNDTAVFPPLTTLYGAITNVNAGPVTCTAGTVPGTTIATIINLLPVAAGASSNVTIPCPVTATAPAPFAGAITAATAYSGNGPGDLTTGTGPGPNMTFLYDAGTVLTITPGALTRCGVNASDLVNSTVANTCNLSVQQNLAPTRPDQPNAPNAPYFNADWQGGVDPVTQRNDATVHDYYTTAEGAATLSVAAINCTNWNAATKNPAVGNWLAVRINDPAANGTVANYTPICTDQTTTTVGTVKAPATFCRTGCTYTSGTGIGDDAALPPAIGGQLIPLDFLTKAFSNRPALNGIPTGLYTAQVYVWSTRAKNSVPGYCLGASMPISAGGTDPTPLCPTSSAIASSANPNPLVPVQNVQTFNVTLFVFDTTQVIQITPNSCQNTSAPSVTEFATVANSENLFTGNIASPFGTGSVPNYANFGPNGSGLVEWSLLPFQTTGTNITGCFNPNQVCSVGANQSVPLPSGVTLNPQTLAQYNACFLPTGTFNGTAINGSSVPGIGTLLQTGPVSQTTFIPAGNGSNQVFTIYACRPTVAPAWLNSPLYPGNAIAPLASFPGGPSPYSNGNGPNGGPNSSAITGALGSGPVPTVTGITCPLSNTGGSTGGVTQATTKLAVFRNGNSFLEDTNDTKTYEPVSDRFIAAFFSGGAVSAQAGDIAVAGDWTGDGKSKVGIYRPSTGQWFLDANNDGVYNAGDLTYFFGGIAGDYPVVGDWAGVNKSCVGISRRDPVTLAQSYWLLDLNCNGTYDSAADAFFPFGGLPGDVPVVGAWTGTTTKVGVVRKYAPGGVPQGEPFFWVLDAGTPAAGLGTAASHQPAAGSFAFGGLAGDVFVTGDWQGNGTSRAGVYRAGSWILDLTGAHTPDTFYQYGGLASDQPLPGKW